MKVKIVVRVSMNGEKSRSKALKITVGISGVESAALSGDAKDQVVVVGENIDAVELTRQLRKGVGCTDLMSVGEDKKKDDNKKDEAAPAPTVPDFWYPQQYANCYSVYEVRQCDPSCTIM